MTARDSSALAANWQQGGHPAPSSRGRILQEALEMRDKYGAQPESISYVLGPACPGAQPVVTPTNSNVGSLPVAPRPERNPGPTGSGPAKTERERNLTFQVLILWIVFLIALAFVGCTPIQEALPTASGACRAHRLGPIYYAGLMTPAIWDGLAEVERVTGLRAWQVERDGQANLQFRVEATPLGVAVTYVATRDCALLGAEMLFADREWANHSGTVVHELGHALGLHHSDGIGSDDVMNLDGRAIDLAIGARFSAREETILRGMYGSVTEATK